MRRYWTRHFLLIPLLTFLLVAAGLLAIWRQLDQVEGQMLDLRTRTTTEQAAFRFENFIAARLLVVDQMAHLWERNQVNTPERFSEMARTIQAEFSTFQAINWIDPHGVIRWLVPEEPNLPAKNRPLQAHAGLGEILALAAAENHPRASTPVDLFQGGRGFGTYFPLRRDGRLEGYINGVFRIRPLVHDCLHEGVRGDFYLRITDGGKELYTEGPPAAFSQSPHAFSHSFHVLDRKWTLSLVPAPHVVAQYQTWTDEILLAIGLVLAAGLAITLKGFLQRQAALQESEQRLRITQFAMDHAAVATFWIREDGSPFYVNEAACQSLGYTREELLTLNVFDIDAVLPREVWPEHWEMIRRKGGPVTFESIHRRKDGSTFPVEITASPLNYKGASYHLSFAKDLTDRKRAEEERLAMERALLETQRLESLGLLAGGVAHDFNNLLTAMMGSVTLAREKVGPAGPITAQLEHIESAAQQAADLARQLLAYSGKGKFVLATFDLRSAIQETEHLLQVSISKRVRLECDLGPDPIWVRGDPGQIRQVVMNLVINAAEAIGDCDGVVTVRTREAETTPDRSGQAGDHSVSEGRSAVLEVSDTGPGMDAQTSEHVFEPFFSTKGPGRGLGLAAVMGILRGHQGSIQFDSRPGRGTTFKVILPCVSPPERPAEGPLQQPVEQAHDGTILVVDDEESVRTVTRTILETSGFSVLTAQDGVEGLELFRQHAEKIRAVLVDVTMPRMSGRETVNEMRRIRPDVRVLLSSGYHEGQAAGELAVNRITGFIQKPYRADQLLARIHEILAN